MLTSATKILLGLTPAKAGRRSAVVKANSKFWNSQCLNSSSHLSFSSAHSCKYGHLSSYAFGNGARTSLLRTNWRMRKFSTSSSDSGSELSSGTRNVVKRDSKKSGESQKSEEKVETTTERLERLQKESERLNARTQSSSSSSQHSRQSSDSSAKRDIGDDMRRESRLNESMTGDVKKSGRGEANQGRGMAHDAAQETKRRGGEVGKEDNVSEGEGNALGRIQPKRLTIEEAEALGINVEEALGKSTSKTKALWENPEMKKKREEKERMKKAFEKDGKPRIPISFDDVKEHMKKYQWWWLAGALILGPTILSVYSNWENDPGTTMMKYLPPKAIHEPNWLRHEYTFLSDDWTEAVIFEMCGLAALAALPSINPITSPLTAIRGDISPVYPKDRQGLGPPTFWKLRIDFPAPRENEWEQNDKNIVRVQPASPDYKGSQFMWILSRTWENGGPVIRILMGRQVGGTTKSNPRRSLIPWREPVFRPRRLHSWLIGRMEADTMFKQLYEEKTMWYQILKAVGHLDDAKKVIPSYDIEDFEYDMLEAKGFTDYLYYPDSVNWPSPNIIIDPLGVQDEEDIDDDSFPLAWENDDSGRETPYSGIDDYDFDSFYDNDDDYEAYDTNQERAVYNPDDFEPRKSTKSNQSNPASENSQYPPYDDGEDDEE